MVGFSSFVPSILNKWPQRCRHLLICMFNFLFSCWNWLVIFEPLAHVKWHLHNETSSISTTHTNLSLLLMNLMNNSTLIYWLLPSEPSSRKYQTCLEIAWRTFSAPKRERVRERNFHSHMRHTQKNIEEKKTSKHGCFRTQSKSSFVSIIRFLLSSSKSVWS